MINVIGYIRVSTEEQSADDKYGIETQKRAISAYASENGYEVVKRMVDTISRQAAIDAADNMVEPQESEGVE